MDSVAMQVHQLAGWLRDNADAEIVHLSGTVEILASEIRLQAAKVASMEESE